MRNCFYLSDLVAKKKKKRKDSKCTHSWDKNITSHLNDNYHIDDFKNKPKIQFDFSYNDKQKQTNTKMRRYNSRNENEKNDKWHASYSHHNMKFISYLQKQLDISPFSLEIPNIFQILYNIFVFGLAFKEEKNEQKRKIDWYGNSFRNDLQ